MKNIKKFLLTTLAVLFAFVFFGCGEEVKVSSIELDGFGFMKVGETQTLTVEVKPDNAVNKAVEWSSSDDAIATVSDAVVTALAEGTVTITAKAKDGDVTGTFSIIIDKKTDDGNNNNNNNNNNNDDEEDVELSTATVKTKLQKAYTEYLAADKAAVKITLVNGEETLETKLSYAKAEGLYTELFFEQKGVQEAGVYVKDNVVYMSANGTKQKYDLDASENKTLVNSYGIEALLKQVTVFYSDSIFFNALGAATVAESVYTFELDLTKYNGNTINAAGKDKIELIITLVDDEISVVTLKVTEGEKVNSITLEYLGFNDTIVFPTDLNDYQNN